MSLRNVNSKKIKQTIEMSKEFIWTDQLVKNFAEAFAMMGRSNCDSFLKDFKKWKKTGQ